MSCSYCGRTHAAGVLCQGVSRRSFFFFGMAFGVAGSQAVRAVDPLQELEGFIRLGRESVGTRATTELDQAIADFDGELYMVDEAAEVGDLTKLARGLVEGPGMPPIHVDGVDLSTYIQEIDFDTIHKRIKAGEQDIFGRPAGLKKLEPFEVTLSGFWEDAWPPRRGRG